MSFSLLIEVSRQLLGLGWGLESDAKGVFRHVNDSVAGARQTIAIWSLVGDGKGPKLIDTIQVEIIVRLHGLEEFIASRLGPLYVNEMGKSVSVFLHRLIPDGRRFAQGFLLEGQPSGDNRSCRQVVDLISMYGFPFALGVASGARLLGDEKLDPRLLDPMKWELRRVLFALARQTNVGLPELLLSASACVEAGLRTKFYSLASFNRGIDPEAEIQRSLGIFAQFAERLEREPALIADLRRHLAGECPR